MQGPRLVMIEGVAPGIGKSTLAASLAGLLESGGAAVDLFPEEQLFTRPTFARVAQAFRGQASPGPELFRAAYTATIEQARAQQAWVIFDWNCAGMASDLPWAVAEPQRLYRLVRDVRGLAADMAPVIMSLQGDIAEATRRAAAERGQTWIDHWVAVAAGRGITEGSELDRIVRYQQMAQELRRCDLAVLERAGWPVVTLDATTAPDVVLGQAVGALGLTEVG